MSKQVTVCGDNAIYVPSYEPGGDCDLTTRNITQNGTYTAIEDDNADGYSSVSVSVPNTYTAGDEGKVVSNGALVSQTSTTKTANGIYDTTLNNEVEVDVANSYTAADEGKVVSNGALVAQSSQIITENGTYNTTMISELVANISGGGGGGGSTNILSGTDAPTASVGSDGDVYLQLGFDGDDSGEGWGSNSGTICDFTTSMGSVSGRSYMKTTDEPALVAFTRNSIYWQPHTASTIPTACNYTTSSGGGPWSYDYSYVIDGVTWYFFSGNYGFGGQASIFTDFPIIDFDYNFATQENAERFLEEMGVVYSISATTIVSAYCKVNGTWQNLIGTDINDVNTGGGSGGDVTIVDWSTGTDEEIVAMLEAAHNGDIDLQEDGGWAIGDVRTITVNEFMAGGNVSVPQQSIDIQITSFMDYMNCGCVMQFDFKDALAQGIRMNPTSTNVGGYGQSEMKTTTIPALVNALPRWLKNNLIEFSCLASEGNGLSTIETVAGNKLALRSEIELFGATPRSVAGEGSHITYYNSDSRRSKKQGHSGVTNAWWERSPRNGSAIEFCRVASSGYASANYAGDPAGVAPFGCL